MGKKLIDNVKAIGSMIDFVGGQYYKVRTEMAKDDDNLVLISSNDRDVYGEAMLCESDEGVVILFKTNSSRTFVFMVEMVVYRVLPEVIRNGDYIFVNDELEVSKAAFYSIKQFEKVEGGDNGEKV